MSGEHRRVRWTLVGCTPRIYRGVANGRWLYVEQQANGSWDATLDARSTPVSGGTGKATKEEAMDAAIRAAGGRP